ncbi:hypothetical protein BKA64DRAFT_585667 [Cadophora sp. MPI-SDFR-AT-0126]|nr:hypothetical protein BKA64DRAFT_585667 [Leotiomycetes sp. MPI-SDFR-AT-0126]
MSALGLSLDTLESSHKAAWSPAEAAEIGNFIRTNRPFLAFFEDLAGRKPTIARLRDLDLTEIRPLIGCDIPEYRLTMSGTEV